MKFLFSALIVLAGFAASAQDTFVNPSVDPRMSNDSATYDVSYDTAGSKREKKPPRPLPTPHQPCGPGELYPCL